MGGTAEVFLWVKGVVVDPIWVLWRSWVGVCVCVEPSGEVALNDATQFASSIDLGLLEGLAL